MSLGSVHNCTAAHCGQTYVSVGNDSHQYYDKTKVPLAGILKLTLEVFIVFIGVIGNVLVIIITRKFMAKKTKSMDFYVQNLAVADLGTLLLTFPLASIKEKLPLNWPFGEFTCLYLSPIPEMFYVSSVWHIAAIAFERYRNIIVVKTFTQNVKNVSQKRVKLTSACVWMGSFLTFSLPLYFVVKYYEFVNNGRWCGPVWPSLVLAQFYIGSLTFLSYIFPLVIISFTYVMVSRAIKQSDTFYKAMARENGRMLQGHERRGVRFHQNRQNKNAKRILTPIVLVFAITMLPLNILRLAIANWPEIAREQYYGNLLYVAVVFVIANASANPVIYSLVNRRFREEIRNLRGKKRLMKSQVFSLSTRTQTNIASR